MGSFLSSQSQLPPECSSPVPVPVPAATASPQWMLLAPYGEECNITGDSKTIATAVTSNGHRITVSIRRDSLSVLSRICLCYLPGTRPLAPSASSTIIAAHGGSVLVRIISREDCYRRAPYAFDYFVYSNVGAAAADPTRPPSLYLLGSSDEWWQQLDISATGFLSHAEADFVVAHLKTLWVKGDATPNKAVELLLFHHGKWCAKRHQIIHDHGKDGDLSLASWKPEAVAPLGDRLLCWIHFFYGVIFSDVLDKGPKLRYVPYPAEALQHQRFLCTNARGAVKLVTVSPRRCSQCGCSQHDTAFNIWTLKTEDVAWVLETETNMVDSNELWALPDTRGYARVHLVYPVARTKSGGHVVTSMSSDGDNVSDKSDGISDESAGPMEEEDEHMRLSVSTPSARASLLDGLQGGNGATTASTAAGQKRRGGRCGNTRSSASPLVDSMVRRSTRTTSKKDGFHEVRLDHEPSKKGKTCPVLLINPKTGEASPIPLDILQGWGVDCGIAPGLSDDALLQAPSTNPGNDE